jgi:hypothetical protein
MDKEIERLEKERIKALREGNAFNYTTLCDDLGIKPEDEHLYERGLADRGLLKIAVEGHRAKERREGFVRFPGRTQKIEFPRPSEHICAIVGVFGRDPTSDEARDRLRLLKRQGYELPGFGLGRKQISDDDALILYHDVCSHVSKYAQEPPKID